MALRTPEQATEWFRANGVPVSDWARENGFSPSVVYALLTGRTRGRRGASHRAAVALGLKRNVSGGDLNLNGVKGGARAD